MNIIIECYLCDEEMSRRELEHHVCVPKELINDNDLLVNEMKSTIRKYIELDNDYNRAPNARNMADYRKLSESHKKKCIEYKKMVSLSKRYFKVKEININDEEISCVCSKKYKSFDNLVKHQPFCSELKCKLCLTCGVSFSTQYTLLRHQKKCGQEEEEIPKKEFACEFCPKSYANKSSLATHLKKCSKFKIVCEELEKHKQNTKII
tara:strand:+ start:218 stop:838 length:621 start_codon:yes stop_codon:yes gene_type:complete